MNYSFFKRPILCITLFSIYAILFAQKKEPVDYINTIIGASTSNSAAKSGHGLGKTFPGAATPFGLVQLSPDTITGGDNGPGYSWHHSTIEGFSFTHMSGIGWFGDFGNFLVMPTTGEIRTTKGLPPRQDLNIPNPENKQIKGWRSKFLHDTEIAKAGYYSVILDDYSIKVELAAAPRSGMMKMTFPKSNQSNILIDLSRRIGGSSSEQFIEKVNANTIQGYMKCPPENGGWGNGAGKGDYTVHFYAQFSKPLENCGYWEVIYPEELLNKRKVDSHQKIELYEMAANAEKKPLEKSAQGAHIGFFAKFETKEAEEVFLKVGISFVSIENAKQNLQNDIKDWDFENLVKKTRKQWSQSLSKMKVEGGSERDKTIFYTALYHTMIDPRAASDFNGEYIAADKTVKKAEGFTYRTIFSGWDVFRSQFPLLTIIRPDIVSDQINTFVQLAELNPRHKKMLPRWEFMNSYSGCMVGDPAISVIADAYAKGIRTFDAEKAFEFCKNTTLKRDGNNYNFHKIGYCPNLVSQTLEIAYGSWCVGKLAELLGKEEDAKKFYEASLNYKNIWDESVKWFRAKDANGNWTPSKIRKNGEWIEVPFDKTRHDQGCVESNNFQQGWFVPHDIKGLKSLMGEEFFLQELETFFDNTPEDFMWNNYYNHPNEPNHQVPFMFNHTSKPYLTQKWTRKICDKAYGDDVLGLVGNEDVGQMSAWYVLASAGIHPICPGDTRYEITSPVFDKIEFNLDKKYHKGKKFTIIAKNNSPENVYIKSVSLNGKPLNRLWIDHSEISKGGTLVLQMDKNPNKKLGLK